MEFIPLKNTRLIKLLNNITDGFFDNPVYMDGLSKLRPRRDDRQPEEYACSEKYLQEALKQDLRDFGYPRSMFGTDMGLGSPETAWKNFIPIQKKADLVGLHLGTPIRALTLLYPDNGFIGWHHNGNAPGYNTLFTYSQDGDGCFKYWDTSTQSIKVHQDIKGWAVKVGYYPNQKTETDRVYWHCAETTKARISLAWIINHRTMWMNMIEEITNGDFDRSIIAQHQMNVRN